MQDTAESKFAVSASTVSCIHSFILMDLDSNILKIQTNYKKNPILYLDPIAAMNNTGQRIVLCQFLKFLNKFCAWQDSNKSEKMPVFHAHIAGVAGTGKSFIMGLITNLTNLCMQSVEASEVLAPTGGAAGSCGGQLWMEHVK